MKKEGAEWKCMKCGYIWKGRKKRPIACPRCKRYDWDKEEKNN